MKRDDPLAPLSYPTWLELASRLVEAQPDWDHVRSLLAEHTEGTIFRSRRAIDGNSELEHVYLWLGEAIAHQAFLQLPSTQILNLEARAVPAYEIVPRRIGDYFDDDQFLALLCERLTQLNQYDQPQVPNLSDFPDWLWYIDKDERYNFFASKNGVLYPTDWTVSGPSVGPIFSWYPNLRLIDGRGRMGFIAKDGKIVLPLDYAYLSTGTEAHEACVDEMPASLAPCDLIDSSGQTMTPADVKILSGTLDGRTAVAQTEGIDGQKLYGFVAYDGRILGEVCWAQVIQHFGAMACVKDAKTGLWGYVNMEGNVVIEPQFVRPAFFNHGYAVVTFPKSSSQKGVIDKTGSLVVPAHWHDVEWFEGHSFLVTAASGDIGLVDNEGTVLVEPRHFTQHELDEIELNSMMMHGLHPFYEHAHAKLRARVEKALESSETLAPIAGLLSEHSSNGEISATGLRGARVTLVEDFVECGIVSVRAGDTGTIGWHYPMSASDFNFSIEAPIEGLGDMPERCRGVPWHLLRQI